MGAVLGDVSARMAVWRTFPGCALTDPDFPWNFLTMRTDRLMRRFSLLLLALALLLPTFLSPAVAQELRVPVHNSFSLPKPLLAQFEAQAGNVFEAPSSETMAARDSDWVSRWTKVVLK